MLVLENFEWIPCVAAGIWLCILARLQQEATMWLITGEEQEDTLCLGLCQWPSMLKDHCAKSTQYCQVSRRREECLDHRCRPRRTPELQNDSRSSSKLFNIFHSQKMCLSSPSVNIKISTNTFKQPTTCWYLSSWKTLRPKITFEMNYKTCAN